MMRPGVFAVQKPEPWAVPAAMVAEDPASSTAAFRSCVIPLGSAPAVSTGTDSSFDRSPHEPVASSRRMRWGSVAGRASVGVLALSLLVGDGQPLEAQEVRARRPSPTAVACQVLSADQIERHTTITSALQSGVTGIHLYHSTGQAGSGARLRLRGNSSIQSAAEPLVYVDGIRMSDRIPGAATAGTPIGQVLDLINPQDVLLIEVFRGPSATALYGTNAAGGVIHVYLKRGDVDPAEQAATWPRCS